MSLRNLSLLIAITLCAGCRVVPEYMRPVNPVRQLKAPGDKALVVFVRPSSGNKGLPAFLMDQNANFLGSAVAGGHFSVLRAPGPQQFIVWGEVEDVLVADLAPGLVYFIQVDPVEDAPKVRFTLKASHRGTVLFPFREEWINDTDQFRVDVEIAKDELPENAVQRQRRLVAAATQREKYVGVDLVERSLLPTDGHSSVGVPGSARPPVVAAMPVSPVAVVAAPVVAAPVVVAPPPVAPAAGFVPQEFPSTLPRGFARGTPLKVKLKNGNTFQGELQRETKLDLKLKIGAETLLFDYVDIASIDPVKK